MEAGVARWQRILLSGGLLEPADGRRTVRDWVVDAADLRRRGRLGRVRAALDVGPALDARSRSLDIALGSVACARAVVAA